MRSNIMRTLHPPHALLNRQPEGDMHRRLDRRPTNLAIALGRMAIATRKQGSPHLNGKEQHRTDSDMFAVDIPTRVIRRDGAPLPGLLSRQPDDAEERVNGDMDPGFEHGIPILSVRLQIPDVQLGRWELVVQEPEADSAGEDGRPAVARGFQVHELDPEDVAWLGGVYVYRAVGWVGEREVEAEEVGGGGGGAELVVAAVKQVEGQCAP